MPGRRPARAPMRPAETGRSRVKHARLPGSGPGASQTTVTVADWPVSAWARVALVRAQAESVAPSATRSAESAASGPPACTAAWAASSAATAARAWPLAKPPTKATAHSASATTGAATTSATASSIGRPYCQCRCLIHIEAPPMSGFG